MKNKPSTGTARYRQGDVLIERIDSIPAEATQQKRARSVVLAHGEVTGHHHVLETEDPADWWKKGEISSGNEKPSTLVGELFVSLEKEATVVHPEHAPISLPAGNYRVTRQREYSPEEIRNVAD